MLFQFESLIGPQDLRRASAWNDSFEFSTRPQSASHFINKLTHGHGADFNFEITRAQYVSAYAHDSCAGVIWAAQPGVFRAAHGDDVFHVAKRFHVIDDRGAHVETQHGWEIGWLDSWIAAFAFQRFDQAGLFAADVSACPAMNVNLGIEPGAKNVFPKKIMFARFFDGAFEDFRAFWEFTSDIDVGCARIQCEAGDQNSFQ